ncbi:MAG: hypothetical protein ABI867_43510 [Kofleriaceae bacterium]
MRKVLLASLIAAIVLVVGLSLFKLVWFRVVVFDAELELGLMMENPYPGFLRETSTAYLVLGALVALASIYWVVRLTVVGASVLFGRPVGHALLFGSVQRALIQGAIVLGCCVAMLFVSPEPELFDASFTIETVERGMGVYVLIGAITASLLALLAIAADRAIAVTQDWLSPEPEEPPRRRERSFTRPPLAAPRGVDANPFRAAPHLDLRGRTVKPAAPPVAAPMLDDPSAPKPKLLK